MQKWIEYALEELGQSERPGRDHNPRILEYGKKLGLSWYVKDEIPWCAIFIGWCLEMAGLKSTRSAMARSYEKYGQYLGDKTLRNPPPDCIVVMQRAGGRGWEGHVTFLVEKKGRRLLCLGGNQDNKVCKAWFDIDRVVAYVWPDGVEIPVIRQRSIDKPPADAPVDTGEKVTDA